MTEQVLIKLHEVKVKIEITKNRRKPKIEHYEIGIGALDEMDAYRFMCNDFAKKYGLDGFKVKRFEYRVVGSYVKVIKDN